MGTLSLAIVSISTSIAIGDGTETRSSSSYTLLIYCVTVIALRNLGVGVNGYMGVDWSTTTKSSAKNMFPGKILDHFYNILLGNPKEYCDYIFYT